MVSALVADLFESHRTHLFSVAYRSTGSVVGAESAVEEAWLRLATTPQYEIEDLREWLTATIGRICLEQSRSAAVRRKNYVGQWLPEPIVTGPAPSGRPELLEVVARHRDCRFESMIALDALEPVSRLALVLRDGGGLPAAAVATVLERPEAAVAAAADAARAVLAGLPVPVTDAGHAAAVGRLLAALESADRAAVCAALHPEARYMADGGGATRAALRVVVGAPGFADLALGLLGRYGISLAPGAPDCDVVRVNGELGLLIHERASHDGRPGTPARVIAFTVAGETVCGAYDLANPAKLSGVRVPH
ncbi:sigma factor [Nocardia aurantia]|uniref:ECF RNA polymerase sigma factor SigJ n=1 Tax=Nocardia aurantia TaxID=2585199 RepID=A0A7K0DGE1_9NOCA|nr:sigma factor [Nocardia aurantia]MQY24717.1 ECF RNA polymerase sigma factor SigJ [Nocardia aurantia]